MLTEQGLVIDSVSHAYGHKIVVRDASLVVGPSHIHCILGPSGSGKTTLLRLAAGLEDLQRGNIFIASRLVAGPSVHVPPERRSVGFAFQDYALFPHLNVRDNVLFGMPKFSREEGLRKVASLLKTVDMSEFENAMPHTLSGGQQQRVALIRALAREPRVMLLDEPFSGLDARLRDEVRGVTLRVLKSAEVATLMVTHDPLEAMSVADSISVIYDGQIEQTGAPSDVYCFPESYRVAEALGEVNRFSGVVSHGKVETLWGPLPAPNFSENQRVYILIRPESFHIVDHPMAGAISVEVQSVRLAGQGIRFELKTSCGQIFHVVGPSDVAFRANSVVNVSLIESAAKVLPQK